MSQVRNRSRSRAAFTLVELLVVIGIIAVLISVLIPVISRVRGKAYEADTRAWVMQLAQAMDRYQQDFRAYPGPLADNELFAAGPLTLIAPVSPFPNGFDNNTTSSGFNTRKFTEAENVVLGLLGGLRLNAALNGFLYDPSQIGLGPKSLNPANPKQYEPYLEAKNLSWRDTSAGKNGHYVDAAGYADDSMIPEFVDKFPEPMPLLILRAKRGVPTIVATDPGYGKMKNSVVTDDPTFINGRPGAYDIAQIIAYTGAYTGGEASPVPATGTPPSSDSVSIGTGKKAPQLYTGSTNVFNWSNQNYYHGLRTVDPNAQLNPEQVANNAAYKYYYPLDAFPYIQNPAIPNTARQKDGYIIISAGLDRIYGTKDDIVSFGSVGE